MAHKGKFVHPGSAAVSLPPASPEIQAGKDAYRERINAPQSQADNGPQSIQAAKEKLRARLINPVSGAASYSRAAVSDFESASQASGKSREMFLRRGLNALESAMAEVNNLLKPA